MTAKVLIYFALMIAVGLVLTGCQSSGRASLAGECAAFENPGFAVQGKRRKDQQAVDRFLETGIVTCGWQRPKGI